MLQRSPIGHRPHADLRADTTVRGILIARLRVLGAEEKLGVWCPRGDRGLHRARVGPSDLQMAEPGEVGRHPADQILLGEGKNLSTIELRAEDRELIGGDVEIVLIDAERRLISEARAAVASNVGSVDLVLRPDVLRIPRGVHSDVEL